jgi:hypothetical protein
MGDPLAAMRARCLPNDSKQSPDSTGNPDTHARRVRLNRLLWQKALRLEERRDTA